MADGAQMLADVMNLLEAEPNACNRGVVESVTQGPDIPALREQLAVLVSTGKSKEAIGVTLTHEDVKRLTDKDVEKYSKRYQIFIGSKTTESLIGSMIDLYAYASAVLNIKDVNLLKEDIKKDFTINKELTVVARSLALKFGNFLALANTALITARQVTFATEQSSALFQQSPAVPEHSAAISEGAAPPTPVGRQHSSAILTKKYTDSSMSAEEGNAQTGQATTLAPATKPAKDPKRVAAGKAAAQKTKVAREAQKKALADAEERAKKAEEKAAKAQSTTAGKGGTKKRTGCGTLRQGTCRSKTEIRFGGLKHDPMAYSRHNRRRGDRHLLQAPRTEDRV